MKVTLGNRKAANTKVGLTEMHYGHAFTVQEDKTLACDMDDAFAKDEIEAGRVVKANTKAPRAAEPGLLDPLVDEGTGRPDLRGELPYDPDIVDEASVRADKQLEYEYQKKHVELTKAEQQKEVDRKRKLLQIDSADDTRSKMGKTDGTSKHKQAADEQENAREADKREQEANLASNRANVTAKSIDQEIASGPGVNTRVDPKR